MLSRAVFFDGMAKKPPKEPTSEQVAAETLNMASMAEALEDYEVYASAKAASIWKHTEIPVPLKLEEQLFVRSYCIDRNPIAAMRRLGHHDADHGKIRLMVKKYLAKPEVQEAIEYLASQMMQKLEVTAERVNRAMAAVAFFDPRSVMEFDQFHVSLIPSRFWTEEQAMAIQSIKMGPHGIDIKLYDRMRATEMLAKQLGQLPDDGNRAEEARIAADEAMARIGVIVDRLFPAEVSFEQEVREKQAALPPPDKVS